VCDMDVRPGVVIGKKDYLSRTGSFIRAKEA
jgi:hypothetical protein